MEDIVFTVSFINSDVELFVDNFIHKTRQRYNKPQSLTTRINLSQLSLEMKSRPPYQLTINDVEPIQNGYHALNIPQISGSFLYAFFLLTVDKDILYFGV